MFAQEQEELLRLRTAMAQAYEGQKADEVERRRLQASFDQLRLTHERLTSQVKGFYAHCVLCCYWELHTSLQTWSV